VKQRFAQQVFMSCEFCAVCLQLWHWRWFNHRLFIVRIIFVVLTDRFLFIVSLSPHQCSRKREQPLKKHNKSCFLDFQKKRKKRNHLVITQLPEVGLLSSTTALSFEAPAKRNPRENPHAPYISGNYRVIGLHFSLIVLLLLM